MHHSCLHIQGVSKRPFPGLVIFVPAVAHHYCLNLTAAFSQPGNGLIGKPCIEIRIVYLEPKVRCFTSKNLVLAWGFRVRQGFRERRRAQRSIELPSPPISHRDSWDSSKSTGGLNGFFPREKLRKVGLN